MSGTLSKRPRSAPMGLLMILSGSVALSACSLPSPVPAPKLATPETLQISKTLSQVSTDRSWPAKTWWSAYGDPQLAALIEEALSTSPSTEIAKARLAKAEAYEATVKAAELPTVNAELSVSAVKSSYYNGYPASMVPLLPHGYWSASKDTLNFSYDLDLFGRTRAAVRAAKFQLQAARLDREQADLVLSSAVATAYADLTQLYADQDALVDAVRIRKESLKLIDNRRKNGLENDGAVAQAKSNLALAQGNLKAQEEQIALSKNRLAVLIGAGPDRALGIEKPKADVKSILGVPETLPANLLGRRPDIQAALLRIKASDAKIDEAKAAFYPNVNLTGYIGVQALDVKYLTKSGADIGGIGPALTLPIFEGGRLKAGYKSASADYAEAVANYNDVLNHALKEVADATTSQHALTERLASAEAAVKASRQAYDVAQRRYRGGLSTVLDVLSAEDGLIAAQRNLAGLKARAFVLDVALVRALGGGVLEAKTQTPAQ